MERKLILSRIQTPDGTILTSHHRHDYVTHTDKNGLEYMLDGGTDYQRVNDHPTAPFKDLSVYSDAPFEEIRQVYCRGGRGKDGTEPLKWVPLCEMSNTWLGACLDYNQERGMDKGFASMMYATELGHRIKNNIFIEE